MDPVDWSRCMANIFSAHDDPQGELQKFRHFIPPFVLRTFCNMADSNVWVVYDQNRVPAMVGESETLIIYKPEAREFEKRHWSETFGAENIYAPYFDNLTTTTWMREGFHKFDVLKRVDRDIFNGLMDPIWQIHQQQPSGSIPLLRNDLYQLRKFLFLMTSLHSRDKTMHLFAHDPNMEDARARRRRFIDAHNMEHPRDVWLSNAEQILESQHYEVQNCQNIFDLDRENYRANAKERFLVFWEAGPGDEFVLTENAFGGFEGGQIGAKKNSQVNLKARELEQHLYTRDFMWHQLYVLSPTLVAALCHGTLMHPDLTRHQRKRYGLRRSILESLPHEIAPKYFKDMTKADASFIKPNWQLPAEVERAFGANVSIERRKEDEILFPVQRLSPQQVTLVNSVLLHNQQSGAKVKSVCCRSPPQYQSLFQSLVRFHHNPWRKYSEEEQNDYTPLIERLRRYLSQVPADQVSAHLQYAQAQQQQQQQFTTHPALNSPFSTAPMQIPDSRQSFDRHPVSDAPGFGPVHVDMRPVHLRPTPSQASHHSSQTSSFTPSFQSSHGYSSSSSQSSTSTRTTSIDTPQFEPLQVTSDKKRRQSPARRPDQPQQQPLGLRTSNTRPEVAPRGSDGSGKTRIDKAKPNVTNIVIEQRTEVLADRTGVIAERGRQTDPEPLSRPKRNGPDSGPDRVEMNKTRHPEPLIDYHQLHTKPSNLPDRPVYVVESVRPNPPERSRTEPQGNTQRVGSAAAQQQRPVNERTSQSSETVRQRKYEIIRPSLLQTQLQPQRSTNERGSHSENVRQRHYETRPDQQPQQHHVHPQPQPQRIVVERSSQGSDPPRRSQYQTVQVEYSQQPAKSADAPNERPSLIIDTSARGRQYETRAEQGQVQRPANPSASRDRSRSRPAERKYQVVMPEQRVHAQIVVNNNGPRPVNAADNSRIYHHVLKQQTEQPQVQTQTQGQQQQQSSQPPPPPPPHQHLRPVIISQPSASDETKGRREETHLGEPQRIVNSSTERTLRPGVEIVRPHLLEPTRGTEPQVAPRVVLENPQMKHLRLETAGKTLTRKHSSTSIANSMFVEIGEGDESPITSDDNDDKDDASWEDEGYGELEELSKPRKPTVRFADRPLSRTGGRALHIERPSSRLGRRVEIVRPVSRNGQRVEVSRKPRIIHAHR